MLQNYSFSMPTRMEFGPGAVKKLPDILAALGGSRVMLVTDPGVAQAGLLEKIRPLVTDRFRCEVYDRVPSDPNTDAIGEIYEQAKATGVDCLVAIGGGSAIDAAKGASCLLGNGGTLRQYGGVGKVPRKGLPLVAIPTTAGTGSEFTIFAVLSDLKDEIKFTISSPHIAPDVALCDPEMTLSLPPRVTAATGMDALTHAVEAYIGRSTTRLTRQKALEATRLVFENVETAYRDGQNMRARANMLTAAYSAGVAFTRSYVGYIHAVAHSLGGQYNIPHGLANAVIMPYVLESYGPCVHKKLHELGIAAGVCTPAQSDEQSAAAFIHAIRDLNARMNIPAHLDGIQESDIPVMAAHAEKEANPLYPVPRLMTEEELEGFYRQVAAVEDVRHGKRAS